MPTPLEDLIDALGIIEDRSRRSLKLAKYAQTNQVQLETSDPDTNVTLTAAQKQALRDVITPWLTEIKTATARLP